MDKYELIFNEKFSSIENIDDVLSELRKTGANQIDSVKLLIKKTGLSLKEVDSLIMNSNTWKDFKAANENLQDAFFNNLEKEDK